MRLNEEGVSELMGYTVLVAVVSIAAVGLLAGSMGSISLSEKQVELAGAASSLKSFAGMAEDAVETDNAYYAACEIGVPPGCELVLMDWHDDFRSVSISSESGELAFLPMGSLTIRSPFRSAVFEGGAVLTNDSGLVSMEKAPSVFVLDTGSKKKALYVSIVSISCNSSVTRGSPATLYIKCSSVEMNTSHLPDGATITLRIRSGGLSAWEEQLERSDFTVTEENGEAIATIEGVSDIYVIYAQAGVKIG